MERFDPAAPRDQQWQLLAFAGRPPGDKELKRYRKEYESLFERDSPTDVDLTTLLDTATVVLRTDTDDRLEYTFQPLADDDEDARIVENLIGTISIDKRLHEVRSIQIRNHKKFSPGKMVKITTLSMSLTFQPIAEGGAIFINAATSNTEGRFMGLKNFSETESIQYREFAERTLTSKAREQN